MDEIELGGQVNHSNRQGNDSLIIYQEDEDQYDDKGMEEEAYESSFLESRNHDIKNTISMIFHCIISLIFMILLRSVFSITLFSISLINTIFCCIRIPFYKWRIRSTNWVATFLYFNTFFIWSLFCISIYLGLSYGTIIQPIKILASNKQSWNEHFFGLELSYNLVFGLTITFVIILISEGIGLGISFLSTFHWSNSSCSESFDRAIASLVILNSILFSCFAYLIPLSIVWTKVYYGIFLIVVFFLTMVLLSVYITYGIYRMDYDLNTTLNNIVFGSLFALSLIHLTLAIMTWCNMDYFYLKEYISYSQNYDIQYIKTMFNEEKYYSVGSLDSFSYCPKELIMPNWEDSTNLFGCLNLSAYYKTKALNSFLFDIIIMIPFFEIVELIFLSYIITKYDDLNDPIKITRKYTKTQEKFRFAFALFFPIAIIILLAVSFLLLPTSKTFPAKYFKPIKNQFTQNIKSILPLSYQLKLDKSKTYTITGLIPSRKTDEKAQIKLKPIDSNLPILTSTVNTDIYVKIANVFAYENNIPIEYTLVINDVVFFNIKIGGLLTGKEINLGEIIEYDQESGIRGIIKGKVYENKGDIYNNPMKYVEIFLVKGIFYPTDQKQIFSFDSPLKVLDFIDHWIIDDGVTYTFNNIPPGYYTIVAIKPNYFIETKQVSITENGLYYHDLVLIKKLKDHQFNVLLSWSGSPRDLDLVLDFPSNDNAHCIVSHLNHCQGAYHVVENNGDGNVAFELIEIRDIGDYDYSFTVYIQENKQKEFINKQFIPNFISFHDSDPDSLSFDRSKAMIKIYHNESRFPYYNMQVPVMLKEKIWKAFTLNGNDNIEKAKLF